MGEQRQTRRIGKGECGAVNNMQRQDRRVRATRTTKSACLPQAGLCHEGNRTRPCGNGLMCDGFFRAQAGISANLQLGKFFLAGWVALA